MTWVKLDDAFFRNSKARAVGKDGREMYLAGLCYCAGSLTDGFIPKRDLALITAEAQVKPTIVRALVHAGLWEKDGDSGWIIPDYLEYNPSAEDVRQQREEGKRRAAASRERAANVRANGHRTNGARSDERSRPPSSSPSRPTEEGKSSSSNVRAQHGGDDEDPRISEAIKVIAERRVASQAGVKNPRSYLRKVLADVTDECRGSVVAVAEREPDWSATEVASAVEAPARAGVPARYAALAVLNEGGTRR